MIIEIEVFGQLASKIARKQTLTLEERMTVLDIALLLEINPEEIGLISINGVQSKLEDLVSPGCRLCFFPPLSGG